MTIERSSRLAICVAATDDLHNTETRFYSFQILRALEQLENCHNDDNKNSNSNINIPPAYFSPRGRLMQDRSTKCVVVVQETQDDR